MADTEKTHDVLSSLPFRRYNDEWVKSAWEKDFTDIDPLSLELENDLGENDYHIETLHKVCNVLDTWIREKKSSREEGFWTVLVENDLSYKSFTAFLAYLMEVGHRRVANGHQREAGLLAASNYFKLVTIPGSGAFKLFHPMLFQRGMDMLKSWTSLSSGQRKRQANISSSQLGSKQGRGKRAKRSTITQDPVVEFSDEDDEEGEALTGTQINRIKKAILSLLKDFIQLLENFSLNQSDSSSHYAVSVLAELTNVDPELFDGDFERENLSAMPVSGLSYKGLMKLLSPAHGEVVGLTTSVFKHLLPRILMLIGENKGVAAQAIPRSVLHSKDHAVNFVCFLLKEAEESVVAVVRILIQHMCAKVPDKAEYRNNVAESVVKILRKLPGKHYATMMEWISKFSRNGKNSYRAFSLDVIGLLLKEPVRPSSDDVPEDQLIFLKQRFLVEIVLARCSDLSPTVRARAIAAFGNCLTSGSVEVLSAVQEIVTPMPAAPDAQPRVVPTPEVARSQQITENESPSSAPAPEGECVSDMTAVNPRTELAQDTPAINIPTPAGAKRDTPVLVALQTPQVNVCLQDSEGVISMLRRRASDEKVMVRKAALQTLENAIRLAGPAYKLQDVEVLKDRCRDPALSVRRTAMQSLTDLLRLRPQDRQLQSAWLDGVLPMVMDRETSAQERCLETLEELVLYNIVPFHRTNSSDYGLVWDLLDIIASDTGVELRRFLQKACQHWSRDGKIKASMINSLKTHINQENDAAAWLLLAEIAPSCSKFNHDFVLDYWKKSARGCEASQYSTCQRVLTVLGYIAPQLTKDDRTELIEDLKTKLLAFEFPPELVAVTVSTLCKLCDSEGESLSEKEKWCTELLFASDTYLSDLILDENQVALPDEDKVVRHLFTLGEIAQLCPANTPKRVFMLVESLIAAPCITAEDSCDSQESQPEGSPEVSPRSSQIASDSQRSQNSRTSHSSQMSQGTQASRYRQSTQILSQFRGSKMSSKIRAHAFITLGKLCLQNEDVAKKCVSALARELETSPDPAIRNNVIVILCDLCIRYTTLVDRYVVNIAACLKDNSALVRKQTLTLLTRLLQEDFLKWKGVLFYRFITSLLDENKDISSFAEFCLIHILLQRNTNMFFHHFVECVFHFNGYEGHSVYNKFQQSDREKQMFSLKGPSLFSKRHKLYTFMLEHMADDQRFKLTAKLCQDVLAGVVDNILPLTAETSQLLKDTLSILCCKEIKLASLRTKPHDDVMDEQDMAAVVMATAKKTLITKVVKRNVIENIVPIVTSLKHFLETHRSPVLKQLMMYLRELMKDYKDEVQEILSADRQLATEIEYDLRKFEEQETNPPPAVGPAGGVSSPRAGASKPGSPAVGRASPRSYSGSPQTTSPQAAANKSISPKTNTSSLSGTPALTRQMSLSTMAILNSAKKAMDKVKNVREARNSPHKTTPDRRLVTKAARTQSDDSDVNKTVTEAPVAALFRTPDNSGKNRRAISTPASVLGNITFHQDQNISLIPPSPIPTALPIRVYGEQQSSSDSSPCGPSKPATRAKTADKNIVYMFSPDKPLPKPRSWKITATPPRKLTDQENEELEEATSNPRPQRRVSARRARLRTSSQSSS